MLIFPRFIQVAVGLLLAPVLAGADPDLEAAEVRLPYRELRRLIESASPTEPERPALPPAVTSIRLHLSLDEETPVVEARIETVRFSEELVALPLIGGDMALESNEPEGATLLVRNGMLCEVGREQGPGGVSLRLRASTLEQVVTLDLPPCPGTQIETADLPAHLAVEVSHSGTKKVVARGQQLSVAPDAKQVVIRILDQAEALEAFRPPEPSEWSWQHQALVSPEDGGFVYRLMSHASSSEGSGLEAVLRLPPEARQVAARGPDLKWARTRRNAEGDPELHLAWESRDLLERDLDIEYLIPARPLDEVWELKAPTGPVADSTRTRFIIPASVGLRFSAEALLGPLDPKSVPRGFSESLAGTSVYLLEGTGTAELGVKRLPVVLTDDATISEASWNQILEEDGSMLTEGLLKIDHDSAQKIRIDTPDGMRLLASSVGGHAMNPIDLGEGKLEIALPPRVGEKKTESLLKLSFTGQLPAFEPLEGTLTLALPRTPLFIRSMKWRIELPSGYIAETSGNLSREGRAADDPASSIRLKKNLCRDDRPETQVFYQNLNLVQ